MHDIGLMKKVQGAEHFEQDGDCVHLGKTYLILADDFFEITANIIHHKKNVDQIFVDYDVKNLDCVDVFGHLWKVPKNLNLSDNFLKIIVFSFLEITFNKFDGDKVICNPMISPNYNGACSLADDLIYLISVSYLIPFLGQSLFGLSLMHIC